MEREKQIPHTAKLRRVRNDNGETTASGRKREAKTPATVRGRYIQGEEKSRSLGRLGMTMEEKADPSHRSQTARAGSG